MSNPNYTLRIDTIIVMHKARRNVRMRRNSTITFRPSENMPFVFANEDGDTMQVDFVNLKYVVDSSMFYEEQEDNTLLEELRESDGPECTITPARLAEYIDYYKSFGWELINGS